MLEAIRTWAANDRLWGSRSATEFNLCTFARVILTASRPKHEDVLDIYVPGTLRCVVCGFEVVSQTLFMGSGDVGMTRAQALNENEGEPCPNDGNAMFRVRWSDRAQDNYKAYVALMEEVIAIAGAEHLPGALSALRAAMGRAVAAVDPQGGDISK